MRRVNCRIAVMMGVATLVAWGCGNGGTPPVESSRTEATVTGTVKVRGKLAATGKVIFDPSNVRRKDAMPRSAPIGKDGAYAITTLIGENSVTVETPATVSDPKLSYNSQVFDVQSGANTLPIELPNSPP